MDFGVGPRTVEEIAEVFGTGRRTVYVAIVNAVLGAC
jgi:hypothetical protein